MKKLLNCKVVLALAICLTMFAGLAMTASAVNIPSCCGVTMIHWTGYCAKCGRADTMVNMQCSVCKRQIHECSNCGLHWEEA